MSAPKPYACAEDPVFGGWDVRGPTGKLVVHYDNSSIEGSLLARHLNEAHALAVKLERKRVRAKARKAGAAVMAENKQPHCVTCICGKRAPVQGQRRYQLAEGEIGRGPGSITWEEHLLAWSGYSSRGGTGQTAQRMAERGGFSYGELVMFLGREPATWRPRT